MDPGEDLAGVAVAAVDFAKAYCRALVLLHAVVVDLRNQVATEIYHLVSVACVVLLAMALGHAVVDFVDVRPLEMVVHVVVAQMVVVDCELLTEGVAVDWNQEEVVDFVAAVAANCGDLALVVDVVELNQYPAVVAGADAMDAVKDAVMDVLEVVDQVAQIAGMDLLVVLDTAVVFHLAEVLE